MYPQCHWKMKCARCKVLTKKQASFTLFISFKTYIFLKTPTYLPVSWIQYSLFLIDSWDYEYPLYTVLERPTRHGSWDWSSRIRSNSISLLLFLNSLPYLLFVIFLSSPSMWLHPKALWLHSGLWRARQQDKANSLRTGAPGWLCWWSVQLLNLGLWDQTPCWV